MCKEQNQDSHLPSDPRICLLSFRNLYKYVWRTSEYEFEDVICQMDDVDLLTPGPRSWFKISLKVATQLARYDICRRLSPSITLPRPNRDYELFVAVCQSARDLLVLNALRPWIERSRKSVCWLEELWLVDLDRFCKGHLKIFRGFDHIVLNCAGTVQRTQDITGRPTCYLPPGVDAIKFCPFPHPPRRSVDVYSFGRRSQEMHKRLLKMVEEQGIFYIYQSTPIRNTLDPAEHRDLIANTAKRSRYLIANAAKINLRDQTRGQIEIGPRFFEGTAAGAVLLGQPPDNEAYARYFDWPDAVVQVPFDSPNIAEIIAELDGQPDRIKQIRKNNIVQSLLRHDWAYRWKAVLDIAGLKPLGALADREERLKNLAGEIAKA